MQHLEYMTAAYIIIWVAILLYFLSLSKREKAILGRTARIARHHYPRQHPIAHGHQKRKKNTEPETPQNASGRTKIPHRGHSPLRRSTQKAVTPSNKLIFCRESIARNPRLENLYQATLAQRIPIQQTDWRAFKHMSDTDTPQGVLGVVSMPTYDLKAILNTHGPFLILDRVSDPGNLGRHHANSRGRWMQRHLSHPRIRRSL